MSLNFSNKYTWVNMYVLVCFIQNNNYVHISLKIWIHETTSSYCFPMESDSYVCLFSSTQNKTKMKTLYDSFVKDTSEFCHLKCIQILSIWILYIECKPLTYEQQLVWQSQKKKRGKNQRRENPGTDEKTHQGKATQYTCMDTVSTRTCCEKLQPTSEQLSISQWKLKRSM